MISTSLAFFAAPPPATATAKSSLPSHSIQTPAEGSTETKKLIIGLVATAGASVIAIVVLVIVFSLLLVVRRRQLRKTEVVVPTQDASIDEGQNTQLYFQQKVELDDEQRRHEIEAVELRYEVEGDDTAREIPGDERHGPTGRQELPGEDHARELDISQESAVRSANNWGEQQ